MKFVVKDRADYEFARQVIARHEMCRARRGSISRRCTACSNPGGCRNGCPADNLPVRVQLQLHNTSGVRTPAVSDAVVLLSGGLDSYTAAAIARAEGFRLFALTIRYGQRHARRWSRRVP